MLQTSSNSLTFRVAVDGRQVDASVPGATLQRLFGAQVDDSRSWVKAYRLHAARCNRAAILKGRRLRSPAVTLQDDDFADVLRSAGLLIG